MNTGCWLSLLLAVAFCFSSSMVDAQYVDSVEAAEVESYLSSLGLDSLHVEFLEKQIERELDREKRTKLAMRLAELYTQQLISPSTTYEQSLQWQLKARQLTQIYPNIDDPVLQIAIFHARYQSVFNDFEIWWQGGAVGGKKLTIADSLRQLVRDLLQLDHRMESVRRELTVDMQFSRDQGGPLESKLARAENVLLHTKYLVGWASYFRALVQPENRTEWLMMADNNFRGFLQIAPNKPLIDVEKSWFDFENVWTSRALIGLALAKHARDQQYLSDYCFELARKDKNTKNIGKLIEVWQLKGLAYSNQIEKASALIGQKLDEESAQVSSAFWVATIENGAVFKAKAPQLAREMIRKGLTGLARQRQSNLIADTMDELNLRLQGNDFTTLWISGLLDFSEAELTSDRNKFESAKIRLAQAISAANNETNKHDIARCKFLLATIRFRNREYDAVETMYASIADALRHVDRATAAQATWRRAQSLIEVSRKDSRRASQAFAVMDQFVREFPESPMVRRVEFEKLRLNIQPLPDDEAVRQLRRIEPNSAHYLEARYEMVQRQYRSWSDANKRNRPEDILLKSLIETEDEYFASLNASGPRRLRLRLLVIDALLRQDPVPLSPLTERLELAEQIAESNRTTQEELYLEYRFLRFRYLQTADPSLAIDEAKWVKRNAIGKPYEQTALIFLASKFNEQFSNSELDRPELIEGIRIYQRLVEINGDEPEKLKSSTNARVASVRLGELYSQMENWINADAIYSKLVKSFPNNPGYLASSARAKMNLGNKGVALPIWRKLSLGVDAGTELWYESKFQLAVCVAENDRESAAKLTKQTLNLSPEMPQEWAKKYNDLQVKLNSESK